MNQNLFSLSFSSPLFSSSASSSPQMDQLSDEEVEVREEEEEEEEDSDKEDQDLDKMFGAWLGELDKLTQVDTLMAGFTCWS